MAGTGKRAVQGPLSENGASQVRRQSSVVIVDFKMSETVRDFYDEFANDYHLIFENWEASIARQAAAIGSILERECGSAASTTVLDCACGIGTQALGLAKLGFSVTGSDVSDRAVERARREASARSLSIPFYAADMRNLDSVPGGGFHAVICMDNALPHLDSDDELAQAAGQIRKKLRRGGTFAASIRDYDEALSQRPVVQGPTFFSDGGKRRIAFQVWDWQDERRYMFHLYITREASTGWKTWHGASAYRAVFRDELTGILDRQGFTNIRWVFPHESGFYQPVVIATADS
jgi:2-polyprenyl-3-methyl-5-hydroxy-6-metoxy-1,4-benzoquinol methylase